MKLVRVYTRKRGDHPDLNDPVIIREGGTIAEVVSSLPLLRMMLLASCTDTDHTSATPSTSPSGRSSRTPSSGAAAPSSSKDRRSALHIKYVKVMW